MKLTEFYTEVARRADTGKTAISAAETRRVLSEAFLVLHKLPAAEAADVFAKGLGTAAKKTAKK
ncbi:MAG: hypothetical protein AAF805_04940 [Planctomycetota bacterium]